MCTRKFISVVLACTVCPSAYGRSRQAVDVFGGKGRSEIVYTDSERLPVDEVNDAKIEGVATTYGISYQFFTKEDYGMTEGKKSSGKEAGGASMALSIITLVGAIIQFPGLILVVPAMFVPSTMKVSVVGKSMSSDRDPDIYYGSKARFKNIGAEMKLSSYPLATEFISLGYFGGIGQGWSRMTYDGPELEGERDRTGTHFTFGYHYGLELTRSIAGSGPVLRYAVTKEYPGVYRSGTVTYPPTSMQVEAVELGWRTGF